MKLLIYLLSFSIFVLLQGLFINGVNACFKEGMIFHKIGQPLKDYFYAKPLYSCVRCMASWWGAMTFIPAYLYLFGRNWEMIPLLIFDIFILVTVNFWIYKKV